MLLPEDTGTARDGRGDCHLRLPAGPSWLAGILTPPGSRRPPFHCPPPAPWTNPQPRAKRGPRRPNPSGRAAPASPPPRGAHPSGLPRAAQVPEPCWAGLLARSRLIPRHMAGGAQRPPARTRGTASGASLGAGRGAGQGLARSSTPASLPLGCQAWEGRANEQGTSATAVHPQAESHGAAGRRGGGSCPTATTLARAEEFKARARATPSWLHLLPPGPLPTSR